MSCGRCWIGFVLLPRPLPWAEPLDGMTSVVDWIALDGATPSVPCWRAASEPFVVDVPDGSVPGVGWSMELAADCTIEDPARARPATSRKDPARREAKRLRAWRGKVRGMYRRGSCRTPGRQGCRTEAPPADFVPVRSAHAAAIKPRGRGLSHPTASTCPSIFEHGSRQAHEVRAVTPVPCPG